MYVDYKILKYMFCLTCEYYKFAQPVACICGKSRIYPHALSVFCRDLIQPQKLSSNLIIMVNLNKIKMPNYDCSTCTYVSNEIAEDVL